MRHYKLFSGRPYPPTDQHAIRQIQSAVENIINNLENKIQEKQDTKQEVQWQQLGKELEYQKIFGLNLRD